MVRLKWRIAHDAVCDAAVCANKDSHHRQDVFGNDPRP